MMNDREKYCGGWLEYHNAHRHEFNSAEECWAAFDRAWHASLPDFTPPIDNGGEVGRMEDFKIAKPPREYVNGPRPHGANGEWIESLTEQDLHQHRDELNRLWPEYAENYIIETGTYPSLSLSQIMLQCMDLYVKTFGEQE